MAGLGRKTFNAGDILLASEVQGYLQDQAVMVFAGTASRSSAIPTPSEGMVTYREDDDAIEVYDGSAWVGVSGGVSSATVGTTSGAPVIGTETISSVDYEYYIFKSSGSITFDKAGTADVLIIGGGGAGGRGGTNNTAGGGGGGGFTYFENYYVFDDTYTVTVGGGGSGAVGVSTVGGWGSPSEFGKLGSFGGGGGDGGGSSVTQTSAASSGGSRSGTANGHWPLQGNAGGVSVGGGGGAGAVGGDTVGAGGAGASNGIISTTVASAQSVGEVSVGLTYYSGGGGGANTGGGGAAGGVGGGGDGGDNLSNATGEPNTGGGGGGRRGNATTGGANSSGPGGSGVVIVRVKA